MFDRDLWPGEKTQSQVFGRKSREKYRRHLNEYSFWPQSVYNGFRLDLLQTLVAAHTVCMVKIENGYTLFLPQRPDLRPSYWHLSSQLKPLNSNIMHSCNRSRTVAITTTYRTKGSHQNRPRSDEHLWSRVWSPQACRYTVTKAPATLVT